MMSSLKFEKTAAYLCGDHDYFENLYTEFPWQNPSRPVLFTRAHKVVS